MSKLTRLRTDYAYLIIYENFIIQDSYSACKLGF